VSVVRFRPWVPVRLKSLQWHPFEQNDPNKSNQTQLTNQKSGKAGVKDSPQHNAVKTRRFNNEFFNRIGRKQTLICEICVSVFTFSMNNFTEM
jgi:hypothetical protein